MEAIVYQLLMVPCVRVQRDTQELTVLFSLTIAQAIHASIAAFVRLLLAPINAHVYLGIVVETAMSLLTIVVQRHV